MLNNVSDSSKTLLEQLMSKYNSQVLKEKLTKLSGNCCQLLKLWIDGYSSQEIQEMLGFKRGDVVKTTRLRCIEKLKDLYKSG